MRNYSKSQAHKGKTAYRTPSRWLAGRPEAFKRTPKTKLHQKFFVQGGAVYSGGNKIGKENRY